MNWFITGTDTGVGKTYVTALLTRAARAAGLDTVACKPLCCGDREDSQILQRAAASELTLNEVNPVWLRPALAPYAAAMIEGRPLDLDFIGETFQGLRSRYRSILVEGVGGWRVPIRRDFFVSDLAASFGLPVVVVVANRLGALNHTILTVESIRAQGLECAGLIVNQAETEDASSLSNPGILEDVLQLPVLFQIRRGQESLELAIA